MAVAALRVELKIFAAWFLGPLESDEILSYSLALLLVYPFIALIKTSLLDVVLRIVLSS